MLENKITLAGFAALLWVLCLALPSSSWAGRIQNLSLLDSEDGDVLIVESDEPLEYQVFDLSTPPRLVMTFPGAEIDDGIVAIKGEGEGVVNLFPKANELGVRLEMRLSDTIDYEVDEQGNSLIVRFDAPSSMANPTNTVLEKIHVQDKNGATEVVIDGQNMNVNHNAFLTNKNRTLVVDLWGAKSKLQKNRFDYASQHVKSITVGEADDRLRLIFDLLPSTDMAQQIDASEDQLVVRLGKVALAASDAVKVESVNFQPDGAKAKVVVNTNVANPVIETHEEKGNTVIDIANASLAQGQELSQDLRAFSGPISQIDTYRVGDDVKIVVRTREEVEVNTFQEGNMFSLNFVPRRLAMAARGEKADDGRFSYTGEKVTFDFKDIDIRNALKLIAEMSDLNIIMSDDVTGTLTMRLVDVPWDQALDLILSARGLGKEQTGNVLRVAPVEVLRNEYESKIEARKGSLQLEPLVTEFITLSYAKADEVKVMLEAASSNQGDKKSSKKKGSMPNANSSGLMSSRGSILVDKRTNTLIVKDTIESINNVKRMIAVIDKPIQQVLIEARIVEASDQFTHSIGVRWGGAVNRQTTANFPGSVAIGAANGVTAANSTAIISGGQSAATTRGFLVDLPAAGNGGSIGLSLGSFSNAINLDLELSAAQADGVAKIISNPRIVTSNLKTATVTQGALLPFVTPATANNPATTELIEAALTLTVTPQITADGGVIMDIKVTKDAPASFGGTTGINSKAVTTNVFVKNGETIVIGGVYTRDKGNNKTAVPFFSEIPFLGWLFKTEETRDNKTELLIFITPKVMNGAAGA